MSVSGKTVIITGASRGIGKEMALRLGAAGMNVVLNASGAELIARNAEEIVAAGGKAIAVQADVSREAEFARVFDAAEAAFGGVDALVNNAGLMINMPIGQLDLEVADRMLAVNLRGVLIGCKLAANRLRDGGSILNISTSVLGMSPPNYGVYCATKAAVEAITRSLSKELGPRGIRVNAVAPGPVDTELLTNANSVERLKMFAATTPLGRLGTVGDIATVVAFLLGEDAGWINGQSIRVNGGMVA
jgi:3-oxoacyl-[acyl-carrier protein] reductase